MRRCYLGLAIALGSIAGCSGASDDDGADIGAEATASALKSGTVGSVHTSGAIDPTNPFFLSLGINGRSCGSCHNPGGGWTMTAKLAQRLFDETDGTDTFFRPHDGANRPDADVSTVDARRAAYSVALTRATSRFTRTVPATAEFTVEAVDDPYGFSTPAKFSNFRRAGSIANTAKQVAITWTGTPGDMMVKLQGIMNGATKSHAQRATDIPVAMQIAGAQFMLGLSFAQATDKHAGSLSADGALGGPANIANQPFYVGINALGGDVITGAPFTNDSSTIFAAWRDLGGHGSAARHRAKIAHGEEVFSTLEFDITGVAGLNDALGQPVIKGRCTTCHNSPNIGGHSEFRLMNTGVADGSRRKADVPLVTVRHKTTGALLQSTDLGRGAASGLWADIGKFKAPMLRGVSARAPHFHDGSAANLHEVLEFYKKRFGIQFRGDEDDLIAFLEAL